MAKRRGLGRGLEALLGNAQAFSQGSAETGETEAKGKAGDQETGELPARDLKHLPLEALQPGKYQPRRDMREEQMQELADSIKAQGILQPIVVRSVGGGKYEIIAGERRWRACQLAGLATIPAIVKDIPDEGTIALGLIENIQRENLNPMEEAVAFKRLLEEFALTQQEVADAVGKSRTAVANLIRLVNLHPAVKSALEGGDLDMGHARALLALKGGKQAEAARTIISKGLSVRQTEALVRRLLAVRGAKRAKGARDEADPDIRQLQDKLSERLGARVRIQHTSKGKGKLVLQYNSLEQLDGILERIK